jgi:hypothetical protein
MNVSFLYGTTDRSRIIRYSDDNFFDSRIVESTNVSDFRFELGVLWRHKLQNNSGLNFGATCGLTTSANASRSVVWDNFKTNSFGVDVVKDTVLLLDSEKGVIELPLSIGFGLQWHDAEHWIVLTDFRMKDWRGTKAFGESIPQLNRSYRISAGAEYTNDSKASSYLRKIHYRAGFYHARTNILLRERHIDEYGLTIGCGLPLRKAYQSQFSFALEAGQRGTTLSDLVQERFIRLVLGLTFNEGWFQKRRYD